MDAWLGITDRVLSPARPDLERCLREREPHLESRRLWTEARTKAAADCAARIESARAEVFAANDGVVTKRMTELEREWRMHSRRDPDDGCMDLWSRIAPARWIDRKAWRDSPPACRVDAAVALAADVAGVEAAETAVRALRESIAARGTTIGARTRLRYVERETDAAVLTDLLAEPLRRVRTTSASFHERAQLLARDVEERVRARLPSRPLLAADIAHAAFADVLFRAAGGPNPARALHDLFAAGYALAAFDVHGVTIEVPRL